MTATRSTTFTTTMRVIYRVHGNTTHRRPDAQAETNGNGCLAEMRYKTGSTEKLKGYLSSRQDTANYCMPDTVSLFLPAGDKFWISTSIGGWGTFDTSVWTTWELGK